MENHGYSGDIVVNHQLGVPPHERLNEPSLRSNKSVTPRVIRWHLITTWDLFRLIRGNERWRWPPEFVQDVILSIRQNWASSVALEGSGQGRALLGRSRRV